VRHTLERWCAEAADLETDRLWPLPEDDGVPADDARLVIHEPGAEATVIEDARAVRRCVDRILPEALSGSFFPRPDRGGRLVGEDDGCALRAACRAVADAMQAAARLEERTIRRELAESLRRIWRGFGVETLEPRLSDDCGVTFVEPGTDREVDHALAAGPALMLDLAVTTSLAAIAMRRAGDRAFPLVLDGATSRLDEEHARRLVAVLSATAGQLVVLQHAGNRHDLAGAFGDAIGAVADLEQPPDLVDGGGFPPSTTIRMVR